MTQQLMRAVQVKTLDGPDAAHIATIPLPVHEDGHDILIDVYASGVSFPDLLMTRGQYQRKPTLPFVPGVEVAGRVRLAPAGSPFRVGDRVAAFVRVGGWAEVVAADPHFVFPLPNELSYVEGAGIVMNYLTAHVALTRRSTLRAGQTLLVLGAAGGLGTALIQVGCALGARVVAQVSTPEKATVALAAGATDVVVGRDWIDHVRALVPDGIDTVADCVGGAGFLDCVRVLKTEGLVLTLGYAGGSIPQVPLNRLLLKNVDVRGVAWGMLVEHEPDYPTKQWRDIVAWIQAGHVRPVVGEVYPLEDASHALRALDSRAATGKITVVVRDENRRNDG